LDAGKLLVEKGANLFKKNNIGISAMDEPSGSQVLQHAKDLIWESVKPLLLLSSACSTSTQSTSLIKVFSISGIVRDYIAPYIMRKGLIIRDPEEDVDEEPEADDSEAEDRSSAHRGKFIEQQQQQQQQQKGSRGVESRASHRYVVGIEWK
jgi:hypothetical protein